MSEPQPIQSRLFGDIADEGCTIHTEGRVLRPALALPAAIADELRLHVTSDGIETVVVDPPNVCANSHQIHAEAFDRFDTTGSFTVGVNLSDLRGTLRQARKGTRTSDPIRLTIEHGRVLVEINREYDLGTVSFGDEQLTIDPDGIREEPSLPDLPEPTATANLSATALADVIKWVDNTGIDYVELSVNDGDLHVRRYVADGDGGSTSVRTVPAVQIEGVAQGDEPSPTLFSLDFLSDIVDALETGLVSSIEASWSEEYPIRLHYQRIDDDRTLYAGSFIQAPRAKPGGDRDE